MLFTKGSGKQFVGEGISDFKEGDVALIGSNVPHLHLCANKLLSSTGDNGEELEPCSGEAIQFSPDLFPPKLQDTPCFHLHRRLS